MRKQVLIVGGVGAGMKTATRLRRLSPDVDVVVLERGTDVSYSACGFPYYASDDVPDYKALDHTPQGVLRDAAYFAAVKGITVLTGHEVTAINTAGRSVTVNANGSTKEMPYDRLVLTTGSTPVKLPLPGAELKGIHNFWFPTEVKAVKQEISDAGVKNAVIIGAGFIGMELAEGLTRHGLHVSVVEMQDRLLPQLLDKEMADSLLKGLQASGIDFRLNEKTTGFTGDDDGRVKAVITDKGEIPAELVIVAVGVRPNTELAKAAGLTIGPTGAISVDDELRTSDPYIFAGGDCAENTHIVSGDKIYAPMGSTANKHGRVRAGIIAEELAKEDGHQPSQATAEKYPGVLGTGICQIMNWQAGATGLNETAAARAGLKFKTVVVPGNDRLGYMPGAKKIIVKLIAEEGTERLLGGQVIGTGGVDKRLDVIVSALSQRLTLTDIHNMDFGYAPPFNGPIDNVSTAANVLINKLRGQMHGVNPKDFQQIKKDPTYTLVDVRTPPEFAANRIAGCASIVNIPLGILREQACQLLKDKNACLITSCQIDLRGYEAEVILRELGYKNAQSLEGGMSAWPYETEHD